MAVLNADQFDWMIRQAAHNIVVNDEKEASKKMNKG